LGDRTDRIAGAPAPGKRKRPQLGIIVKQTTKDLVAPIMGWHQ
jgi:hypothetical protein